MTTPSLGFHYENCAVLVSIGQQSPDISQGVTEGTGLHKEQGAGDQGLMFGYACRETPAIDADADSAGTRDNDPPRTDAPDKEAALAAARRQKPGNSRIHKRQTVAYPGCGCRCTARPGYLSCQLRKQIIEKVVLPVLPKKLVDKRTVFHINATGKFVIGGPVGDCGLTGRKIIVDTYGGRGRHGGGCFSGKDPTKVDRTASYMARYIAKNIVAADLADACEIQLSYVIGFADPLSVLVDTKGTGKISDSKLSQIVRKLFPTHSKGNDYAPET